MPISSSIILIALAAGAFVLAITRIRSHIRLRKVARDISQEAEDLSREAHDLTKSYDRFGRALDKVWEVIGEIEKQKVQPPRHSVTEVIHHYLVGSVECPRHRVNRWTQIAPCYRHEPTMSRLRVLRNEPTPSESDWMVDENWGDHWAREYDREHEGSVVR